MVNGLQFHKKKEPNLAVGWSQGLNKAGGRNRERRYQRTWTSKLLQTTRKSCFLLDTSIVIIKLSVWTVQNFMAGHE